jgi:uncharacterized membrane protein YhiD involved in acid resistance
MSRVSVALLATFAAILLVSGLLAYMVRDRAVPAASTPSSVTDTQPGGKNENPLLWAVFGPDASGSVPRDAAHWEATAARITLRFSLAAFLAGLLAFRIRRGLTESRRNPFVAQTQILMAVVAAAMMMVVGDSAARAFGIFAAASLVRFRTNIRDPKEITVLLICLGVGLAAGVGRWDMALILTVFVLIALAILESFEQSQVFRSMELCIQTRDVEQTNVLLMNLFKEYKFDAELRELDRQDEDDPLGKIVYLVDLSTGVSTSKLSEEMLAADTGNIDSVEWDQKESKTYIYK